MSELPRYLQLLWGREAPGRRGPRPTRTIAEIGAAGVELADRDGLAAISMKRVADAVGFTTMSLYRYVDSKEQLIDVMADLALGPPGLHYGRLGWRRRIELWARGVAERRLAHPWMLDVARDTPPLVPNQLAWTEAGLEALAPAALTAQERLSVMLAVDGWGHQHVRQSLQLGLVGVLEPGSEAAEYSQRIAMLVDPERFPNLVAASLEALDDDGEEEDFYAAEFDRGLGLLLDGVDALVKRRR